MDGARLAQLMIGHDLGVLMAVTCQLKILIRISLLTSSHPKTEVKKKSLKTEVLKPLMFVHSREAEAAI
jgi:hypothetical protein